MATRDVRSMTLLVCKQTHVVAVVGRVADPPQSARSRFVQPARPHGIRNARHSRRGHSHGECISALQHYRITALPHYHKPAEMRDSVTRRRRAPDMFTLRDLGRAMQVFVRELHGSRLLL